MSTHVDLTEAERAEVITFWREFILSGGEIEGPSAFQYDALNDEVVRDAYLFWQVGGDPFSSLSTRERRPELAAAYDAFGPVPSDIDQTFRAQTKALNDLNVNGVDEGDLDVATVLILAHIIWLMALREWDEAIKEMESLNDIAIKASQRGYGLANAEPQVAISYALSVCSQLDAPTADAAVMDLFGLPSLPEQRPARASQKGSSNNDASE